LDLVQAVLHVDDKFPQKPLGVFAELALDVDEELPEGVVDGGGVGIVDLVFLLLFVLFPVLFGLLQVYHVLFAQLLYLLFGLSVLVCEGEELVEVPFKQLQAPDVLRFFCFLVFFLSDLLFIFFFGGVTFGVLCLSVMLGFDVSVKGRVG
jgi:hypothetical protein